MSLNSDLCPYCFSKFADLKYTEDPLLVKGGSKFIYDEISGLLVPQTDPTKNLYQGFTIVKNKHIKELQDANDDNKPIAGWTPVEGAPGSFWIPNKIHIKELRDAIEKGLGITGSTTPIERTAIMEQYLNYDVDGIERQKPHQLDWIDPTLTSPLWQGNITHMHIEDLRKFTTQDVAMMDCTAGHQVYVYLGINSGTAQVTLGNKTDSAVYVPFVDASASVTSKGRYIGNASGVVSATHYWIGMYDPDTVYYTLVYLRYFQNYTPYIPITPTLTLYHSVSNSGGLLEKYITFINNGTTNFFFMPPSGTNIYSFFTSSMGRVPTALDKVFSVHCLAKATVGLNPPPFIEWNHPDFSPESFVCSGTLIVSQMSFIS
jgi:hypothetical protein